MKAALAKLPEDRRKIITSHDAFGYFGAAYGLEVIAPEGVSTESEASAQDVAKIIRQIKAEHIPAVFMENITDHRLLDQIARETGAKIGGDALYRRAVAARRPGADLSRHVPPQCRRADRGAVELARSRCRVMPVSTGHNEFRRTMMRIVIPALAIALLAALAWLGTARAKEHEDREFRECRECPVMIGIPSGTFLMGSPATGERTLRFGGPAA